MSHPSVRNALTIDVEDWYQVSALDDMLSRSQWAAMTSRVERSTARLLEILDRRAVRATFFVLGCVARRHPALLRDIASAGHEIASHGDVHHRVCELTPSSFSADLALAEEAIHAACAVHPTAFRAPSFSISEQATWAYDVLLERGYTLSSSVFPVRHDRYGFPDFPRHPVTIANETGRSLIEVPMTTLRVAGRNWPVAGGGWMRVLPPAVMRHAFVRANREGLPAVLYLHPWELDPAQPVLPGTRAMTRWRHRVNLGRMADRLDALLAGFPFTTLTEAVKDWLARRGGSAPTYSLPAVSLDVEV